MELTKEQIVWINQEKITLKRIIAAKPSQGYFRFIAREEALDLLIEMHNMALAVKKLTNSNGVT